MNESIAKLLHGTELFADLDPDEIADALALGVEKSVAKGEIVFSAGDEASTLYVVVSGRLKLTQLAATGHEVIVRFIGPGELVAAVAGFAGGTYPVTAIAIEPTRLRLWSRQRAQELFRRHPAVASAAMAIVSERMREMQNRLRELATERVAQRVARALVRLVSQAGVEGPDGIVIDIPLSRQTLAELTGTTLYTVSRLLSDWESRGLIASGRERVTVCSPHGLMKIAEEIE